MEVELPVLPSVVPSVDAGPIAPATREAFAELERLCAEATEGPWLSDNMASPYRKGQPFSENGASIFAGHEDRLVVIGGQQDEQGGAVGIASNADAAFIAGARTGVPALLARVRELEDIALPRMWGYLFDNPDTGREHAQDHPIRSGEVPDAKNISAATGPMLLRELHLAWEAWAEDRQERDRRGELIAGLRARAETAEARALDLEGQLNTAEGRAFLLEKALEPFGRVVELIGDGMSVAICRDDGSILVDDPDFRRARDLLTPPPSPEQAQ
jgi:hypothetical protein